MDFPPGRKKWPLQRGGRCREVAVIRGSTVLKTIKLVAEPARAAHQASTVAKQIW